MGLDPPFFSFLFPPVCFILAISTPQRISSNTPVQHSGTNFPFLYFLLMSTCRGPLPPFFPPNVAILLPLLFVNLPSTPATIMLEVLQFLSLCPSVNSIQARSPLWTRPNAWGASACAGRHSLFFVGHGLSDFFVLTFSRFAALHVFLGHRAGPFIGRQFSRGKWLLIPKDFYPHPIHLPADSYCIPLVQTHTPKAFLLAIFPPCLPFWSSTVAHSQLRILCLRDS